MPGFSLPLASAIIHSVNPWDMALWAVIALIVQIFVFVAVRLILPNVTKQIQRARSLPARSSGCCRPPPAC